MLTGSLSCLFSAVVFARLEEQVSQRKHWQKRALDAEAQLVTTRKPVWIRPRLALETNQPTPVPSTPLPFLINAIKQILSFDRIIGKQTQQLFVILMVVTRKQFSVEDGGRRFHTWFHTGFIQLLLISAQSVIRFCGMREFEPDILL